MRTIKLQRTETSDEGTFGVIKVGPLSLFTLELPWRDDNHNLSCIPAGKYRCEMTMSDRFKRRLYLVGPVPGRFGIRIHSANLAGDVTQGMISQLHGCIALGEKRGMIGDQKAVLLSKSAVRKFEKEMKNESFILEVLDVGSTD
jgi:hypothetical protein